MSTEEEFSAAFDYSQKLIGAMWIEYQELQKLTTTSLIDHALRCQKFGYECLNRKPYRDEKPGDPGSMWAAYRNQVMWCLQVLNERGAYTQDPYRDDKSYQYK